MMNGTQKNFFKNIKTKDGTNEDYAKIYKGAEHSKMWHDAGDIKLEEDSLEMLKSHIARMIEKVKKGT